MFSRPLSNFATRFFISSARRHFATFSTQLPSNTLISNNNTTGSTLSPSTSIFSLRPFAMFHAPAHTETKLSYAGLLMITLFNGVAVEENKAHSTWRVLQELSKSHPDCFRALVDLCRDSTQTLQKLHLKRLNTRNLLENVTDQVVTVNDLAYSLIMSGVSGHDTEMELMHFSQIIRPNSRAHVSPEDYVLLKNKTSKRVATVMLNNGLAFPEKELTEKMWQLSKLREHNGRSLYNELVYHCFNPTTPLEKDAEKALSQLGYTHAGSVNPIYKNIILAAVDKNDRDLVLNNPVASMQAANKENTMRSKP